LLSRVAVLLDWVPKLRLLDKHKSLPTVEFDAPWRRPNFAAVLHGALGNRASLENEQEIVLLGLRRIFRLLPSSQQRQFLAGLNQAA
jgi:hypothetical protein